MSKDKVDHDALSIYIGNVDYSATEEELRNTFIGCGEIVRVTIIKNKLHFLEVEFRPLIKRTDLANNKTVIFNFTSQRISF